MTQSMKHKFYYLVALLLFTCIGQMVANGQVKPAPKPMPGAMPKAAPALLSADEKLTRVRTMLKAQTKIKFDSAKLDSAKLGGPLCTLSVKHGTESAGNCILELTRPAGVSYRYDYADMIDKDGANVMNSTVEVSFNNSQAGLYIVDFSLSYGANVPNQSFPFYLLVDDQKNQLNISLDKQGGHLVVPVAIPGGGNGHSVTLSAGGYWVFHSVQITKVY